MGRTVNPDSMSDRPGKSEHGPRPGGRGPRSSQPRSVLISKALSRLLRHQAENEGVPITKDGWVRLDQLLAWKGLTSRNGVSGGPVTLEEIWNVVEDNEKKRFAVRLAKDEQSKPTTESGHETVQPEEVGATEGELQEQPDTTVSELAGKQRELHASEEASVVPRDQQHDTTQAGSETARAIAYFRSSVQQPPASEFLIRATQGHSIKAVTSDDALLTRISLSDSATIPTTCVHGTFYGSWPAILASSGLKRMGRNHVHFAEGPTLAELGFDERGEKLETNDIATRSEVISGMRKDAQLLIYVDVKRALQDQEKMEWWRSENGVILTEGVETTTQEVSRMSVGQDAQMSQTVPHADEAVEMSNSSNGPQFWKAKKYQAKSKQTQATAQNDKMVPSQYWTVVVDAKGGQGVIWRQGEGVVKELPQSLTSRGPPKSKGRGGGRGGRGGGRER